MKKLITIVLIAVICASVAGAANLKRIKYNNPGLEVDLGVGLWAWPIPMDYDEDGDNDLLVVCPDKPCNCTYFFENVTGNVKIPVFAPAKVVGKTNKNIQPSYVNGKVRLLSANKEIIDYKKNKFSKTKLIYPQEILISSTKRLGVKKYRVRANQWKYVDYDGDNKLDLIAGVEDWTDYGWDNAYDKNGNWKNGPLHGYIFYIHNKGTNKKPVYDSPVKIQANGRDIDGYGMPSPNFADFDGDGDLDIICGEFVDKFTYYQNIGTRQKPVYAEGKRLEYNGQPIKMNLEMIVPVAFDWDKDGDFDLIVGDEDGRVALIENTGNIVNSIPQFLPPVYFRQQANEVKVGALATPFCADLDSDGDEDIISGNTAGNIVFVENIGGGAKPKWAEPKLICIDDKPIRIMAGKNGSIQGPAEEKWGYTTFSVADWDGDGLLDIVANSILGKIIVYKNIGIKQKPQFADAVPITVAWKGKAQKPKWNWWNPNGNELVTQWRTMPFVIDLNKDGMQDLVMLDHEGYLAFYERIIKEGQLTLLPGKRIFKTMKHGFKVPLRLNAKTGGGSGRREFCMVDWDLDGKLDLLVDSKNANFLKNVAKKDGEFVFEDKGQVDDLILAGHSTKPATVDWDKNNIPDLLLGAEDGFLYYLKNPNSPK